MAILEFPSPETSDPHGLVAIGGDLEVASLKLAYTQGIYPWPTNDIYPIPWFSPDPRGILEFKDLKISHSLKKSLKKNLFHITMNTDFESVILACAQSKRKEGTGTWITKKMIEAYIDFHYAGMAYSVEAWAQDKLVGGLYGVNISSFVSGESMFYSMDNASKYCLVYLMNYLNQHGVTWLDTQMVTPVISKMGGKEVSRKIFLKKLSSNIKGPLLGVCNGKNLSLSEVVKL